MLCFLHIHETKRLFNLQKIDELFQKLHTCKTFSNKGNVTSQAFFLIKKSKTSMTNNI